MMMDAMKAENEKLAAAGVGNEGNSKLEDMLAAKQAELQVPSCFPTGTATNGRTLVRMKNSAPAAELEMNSSRPRSALRNL